MSVFPLVFFLGEDKTFGFWITVRFKNARLQMFFVRGLLTTFMVRPLAGGSANFGDDELLIFQIFQVQFQQDANH